MKNRYENLIGSPRRMGRPFSGFPEQLGRSGGAWKVALIGGGAGMLLLTLFVWGYHYAGSSGFCRSCHSMSVPAGKWKLSMHKQFSCTECHLPTGGAIARVAYKVGAGMNDLFHEIKGDYPVFIGLSTRGRVIADGNCLRCHFSAVERTSMVSGGQDCLKCHRHLVHGKRSDR